MTEKLIHRHDQFFKRLLDKPGTAGALLRERLPADVAARLTDDPPELVPGSFVPKELVECKRCAVTLTRPLDVQAGRFAGHPQGVSSSILLLGQLLTSLVMTSAR